MVIDILEMLWLFLKWLFIPSKKPTTSAKKQPEGYDSETNSLYGFDLNEWHYIGSLDCTKSISYKLYGTIFMFCRKDDHNIRDYVIISPVKREVEKTHFVKAKLSIWKMGEYPIEYFVMSEPSKWLQSRNPMQKWDTKSHTWVKCTLNEIEDRRYKKSLEEQNSTASVITNSRIDKVEGNVLIGKFPKDSG